MVREGGDGRDDENGQAVAEQLESVRQDGRCNMLDRPCVQWVADDLGHHELVLWLEDHKGEYRRLIFEGFEVTPVTGGRCWTRQRP